jgi:hypothetical protein
VFKITPKSFVAFGPVTISGEKKIPATPLFRRKMAD